MENNQLMAGEGFTTFMIGETGFISVRQFPGTEDHTVQVMSVDGLNYGAWYTMDTFVNSFRDGLAPSLGQARLTILAAG